jgi:hypothetical protein
MTSRAVLRDCHRQAKDHDGGSAALPAVAFVTRYFVSTRGTGDQWKSGDNAAGTTNPGTVWIESTLGGTAGPMAVTNK